MVEAYLFLCFASFGVIVLLCFLEMLWCKFVSDREEEDET